MMSNSFFLVLSSLSQEVRQCLHDHSLKLNTDLGQHFLIDQSILESIVKSAEIKSHDHIVEIGPGIGVLTRALVSEAKTVTAIELDERMIPPLSTFLHAKKETEEPRAHLTIINGNALLTPMPDTSPYKIVANIPYHITSPLLRHVFLESTIPPISLTLLIQREVADRICDTENASLLTILVSLFGTPRKIIDVPPEAFLPPPKVESAVVHIDCFQTPIAPPHTLKALFRLTKIAFSQKRKMLRNSFGTFQGGRELLSAAGIDETRRPQTLSIDEWIAIANVSLEDT